MAAQSERGLKKSKKGSKAGSVRGAKSTKSHRGREDGMKSVKSSKSGKSIGIVDLDADPDIDFDDTGSQKTHKQSQYKGKA